MTLKDCKCSYCSRYGFPVLWRIKNNLLWYEIPKNGSWTIKESFKGRGRPKQPNLGDKILIVWRNPKKRFKSLFMHYFLEEGGRFNVTQEYFTKQGVDISSYSVLDRRDLMFDRIHEFDTDMEVHHFYPQTKFLSMDFKSFFRPIDIKDLSLELQVPVLNNTTKKRDPEIEFTSPQLDFIHKFYSEDFDFMREYNL